MAERPRAYRLDRQAEHSQDGIVVVDEPDAFENLPVDASAAVSPRRGWPWGAILASALGSLVVLGIGLWAEQIVSELFAANPALGGFALLLAGLALLAFLVLVGREVWGIVRERAIERLHKRAVLALASGDDREAARIVDEVVSLYGARAETASGRAALAAERDTLIDADDRLAMAERAILSPLDRAARLTVASAARQVSLVTAVSPRAIIDVAFTLYASARLIRQVSAIYGGRPGFLGFVRLVRGIATQLLVTGGMAAGDSLLSQAMGHGLAARISAKAGEGVLNGLLTARIGLAAIHVCRPLPFVRLEPPRVADVAGDLFTTAP